MPITQERVISILREYNATAEVLRTIHQMIQDRFRAEEPNTAVHQFCSQLILAAPIPAQPRRAIEWEHFARNAKHNEQNARRAAQLRKFPGSRQRRFAPRPTATLNRLIPEDMPFELPLGTDDIEVIVKDEDLNIIDPKDIENGIF